MFSFLVWAKSFSSKYTTHRKNGKMYLIVGSIIILTSHREVKTLDKEDTSEKCCSPLLITVLRNLTNWQIPRLTLLLYCSFPTLFILFPPLHFLRTFVSLLFFFYCHSSCPPNGPPSSTAFQGCGIGWLPNPLSFGFFIHKMRMAVNRSRGLKQVVYRHYLVPCLEHN